MEPSMSKHLLLAVAVAFASTSIGCVAGEDEEFEWTEDDNLVSDGEVGADQELEQMLADGKADGVLTYLAVARLARDAGFPCTGSRIATAVAVAKAESSFRPRITNTVGNTRGIDRGLWQINSYWHPEVSASCALSASCNARAAARISSKGTSWTQWWTWKNNKHAPFMSQARAAQATACAE
jgi:hypothetical protein